MPHYRQSPRLSAFQREPQEPRPRDLCSTNLRELLEGQLHRNSGDNMTTVYGSVVSYDSISSDSIQKAIRQKTGYQTHTLGLLEQLVLSCNQILLYSVVSVSQPNQRRFFQRRKAGSGNVIFSRSSTFQLFRATPDFLFITWLFWLMWPFRSTHPPPGNRRGPR